MEVSNDNFICIDSDIDEIVNDDKDVDNDCWQDQPLNGLRNEAEESTTQAFYRMDRVVFAEPINSVITGGNNLKESDYNPDNEKIFVDNIVVEKRKGRKYRKYHIDVDSSNPVCHQPNCKRKFSTTTLLKAHIRKIHCADPNAFVCDRCGTGFKSQLMLRRHSAVHEMRRAQCKVCRVTLSERTKCGTGFKSQLMLSRHFDLNGIRRAQCKVCRVTLSEATHMAQHLRSHSNTRRHECLICHKLFLRKSTLNVHVKFVHRNGELKCDKCDARFRSRSELSRHSSTHRQTAPKI